MRVVPRVGEEWFVPHALWPDHDPPSVFVGARGWPVAVHMCYESRLLAARRACDEDKYWRAMKLRCSKNDARARAAATEFCRHLSTRLETCSRVLRRCCITFARRAAVRQSL